jgi:glucose-6-phosphate-specific signal transduction histidine kinase
MGTAVVFGMTCAMVLGIFLVPVCYVFVQRITDREWTRSGADKVSPDATKAHEGDIAKSEV